MKKSEAKNMTNAALIVSLCRVHIGDKVKKSDMATVKYALEELANRNIISEIEYLILLHDFESSGIFTESPQ